MTRQGYLLVHEKRARPRVCFFALEDGVLRYYLTARRERCVGEVRLSGCKLVVKAQKRHDLVPHSFFVEARKVFVKDRSYTLGAPARLELSAASGDDRQEWGKALFSWQRYYWRDPQPVNGSDNSGAADEAVREQLEATIDQFYASKESGTLGSTLSLSAARQPLSFLRRNASSLRRSLSMSLSASSASTASSSASDQTPTKPEMDDSAADCAATAAKLAFAKAPLSTGGACPATGLSAGHNVAVPTPHLAAA